MPKLSTSPDRNTFQLKCYLERCKEDGVEPREDYIDLISGNKDKSYEQDPKWKENNLEYDLRSTDWIVAKAREREDYAQNIYAALCNQEWQRNDVWPRLSGETWGCSWRYAGGIVADMVGTGDYIDWYCSGIKGAASDEDLAQLSPEDQEKHHWMNKHFVGEGYVTDEIREDFFKLGWIPVEQQDDL